MTHKEPIYTVAMPVGAYYPNVILNVTYSGGENENDLVYECVTVSHDNLYSGEQIDEINELLEAGYYEDVINYLQKQYANSDWNFMVD
jgi:hypothetical protein